MDYNEAIRKAASLVKDADSLLIGAGAGIGIDSGLPDFRGDHGFWEAYPALGNLGIKFSEIASPWAIDSMPTVAWGFYGHRLNLYRTTNPHNGFRILRNIGDHLKHGYFIYTSNVDGQFQKAGFNPSRIVEIHGSIHQLQCLRPCQYKTWPADPFLPEVNEEKCELISPLPRCPYCGSILRPTICMFNDNDWVSSNSEQQLTRFRHWQKTVSHPLIIELGAGTAISSVRYLSDSWGPPLIRVNPRAPEVNKRNHIGVDVGALRFLTDLEIALR